MRTADPQCRQGGERCERRSKAETVRARTAGGACDVLGSYAMGERSTRRSGRRRGAARTSPLGTPPAVVGRRACECLLQQVQSVAKAAGEIDWDIAVDSTIVGAHQHAAGDRTDPPPAPAQRGRADAAGPARQLAPTPSLTWARRVLSRRFRDLPLPEPVLSRITSRRRMGSAQGGGLLYGPDKTVWTAPTSARVSPGASSVWSPTAASSRPPVDSRWTDAFGRASTRPHGEDRRTRSGLGKRHQEAWRGTTRHDRSRSRNA